MERCLLTLLAANPARKMAKGAVFDGLQLVLYSAHQAESSGGSATLYNCSFYMTPPPPAAEAGTEASAAQAQAQVPAAEVLTEASAAQAVASTGTDKGCGAPA